MNSKILKDEVNSLTNKPIFKSEPIEAPISSFKDGVKVNTFKSVTIFTISESKVFNNQYLKALYYDNDIKTLYARFIGSIKLLKVQSIVQYDTIFLKIAIKNSFKKEYVNRFIKVLNLNKWASTSNNEVRFNSFNAEPFDFEAYKNNLYIECFDKNLQYYGFTSKSEFLTVYSKFNSMCRCDKRMSTSYQAFKAQLEDMELQAQTDLEKLLEPNEDVRDDLDTYLDCELSFDISDID